MNKQHHFVIVFDERSKEFSIDWETCSAKFGNENVWNDVTEKWESAAISDIDLSNYDRQEFLDSILSKNLEKLGKTMQEQEN